MNCRTIFPTMVAFVAVAVSAADVTPGRVAVPQEDSFQTLESPKSIFPSSAASPAPPLRQFNSVSKLHAQYARDFAERPGLGVSRIPYLPPQTILNLAGKQYRVRTPDLLGLEGPPAAYRSGHRALSFQDLSQKEARSLLTKRELNEFEVQAVPKLRAGKDLVQAGEEVLVSAGTSTNRIPGIRVVGALRATTQCVACHQTSEGTVLGALSYILVPAEPAEAVLAWNGRERP